MRLDSVTAEIRPRSDWETVDLGFAMVRRDFWRCFAVWWLAVIVPTVIASYLLWDYPGLVLLLFIWWKPAASRMVLFELSRRLFGENPDWRAVWRQIPRAWVRRFFYRFLWGRFSRWLPVILAVEDLEGLRGKAYKQRSAQVARRGDGVVNWLFFGSQFIVAWLTLGILFLVLMFIPEGQDSSWQMALEVIDVTDMTTVPLFLMWAIVLCAMMAISLTDIFVTGAGFGIYINNRTWIEGWDVELALKRLAQRLTKVAVCLVAFIVLSQPAMAKPADREAAAEKIAKIRSHPDFKVHTVILRVPKNSSSSSTPWFAALGQMFYYIFAISVGVLLIGLIGWAIWRNRHVLKMVGGSAVVIGARSTARVVMGMEISSASLPPDVPAVAWAYWQKGLHHEALALLYRGAISRVIDLGRVEILESDTEGDCLRRVEARGPAAHPDYFRGITTAWIGLAYAGIRPADSEVEAVCQQWPFGKGGTP